MYSSRAFCNVPVHLKPEVDGARYNEKEPIITLPSKNTSKSRQTDKKHVNGTLRKFFNKKETKNPTEYDHRPEPRNDRYDFDEAFKEAFKGISSDIKSNPNVRPLGQKLRARDEQLRFLPKEEPSIASADNHTSTDDNTSVAPSNPFSDNGNPLSSPSTQSHPWSIPSFGPDSEYGDASNHSVTSVSEAQHSQYYQEGQYHAYDFDHLDEETSLPENRMRCIMFHQIDDAVSQATQDSEIVPTWKHWLYSYASVSFTPQSFMYFPVFKRASTNSQ